MWTRFMDMHSGGGTKEGVYEYIYIEAPQDMAEVVFYNRFDHNPNRVSCTCCGEDYSISESESLEQATAYERNCHWDAKEKMYVEKKGKYGKYASLSDYIKQKNILIIAATDIKSNERKGTVPKQGYVWMD
jgi:hypothetical protein